MVLGLGIVPLHVREDLGALRLGAFETEEAGLKGRVLDIDRFGLEERAEEGGGECALGAFGGG